MHFTELYKGKPRHKMPARSYALFIEQLEKFTSEKQKEFARLEKMQAPYLIVKEVLEDLGDLKNDIKLEVTPGVVVLKFSLLETDWYDDIREKVLPNIGKKLFHQGAAHQEMPLGEFNRNSLEQRYNWGLWYSESNSSCRYHVIVYFILPRKGTKDYQVNFNRHTEVVDYSYETLKICISKRT